MSRPYPTRNPFPYQGTLSIEGSPLVESDDPIVALTVRLEPVKRASEIIRRFLNRFTSTEKRLGHAVVFFGDHGAGKTHTIYYLRDQVARGELGPRQPDSPESALPPIQLYAKAEGPLFLDVCLRLMKDVPFPVFRNLNERFFGVLSGEELGRELGDKSKGRETADLLRNEPRRAGELFDQYAVDKGAVQERQATEVDNASGKVSVDFQRAVSFLHGSSSLAAAAYNWLTGRPVSAEEVKQLGVSGPISSDDDGRWSIQLLATLCRRAGRPLIVYMDQYEKLVVSGNTELAGRNVGRLHSLVEAIGRENGMLILAGNEEAWTALPRDLRERFSENVVSFPVLSEREARELVCIYVSPSSRHWEPPTTEITDDDIFPFVSEAIRAMLEFGAGNIRRFLQLCAAVFEEAFPQERIIARALVKDVFRRNTELYFTKETVTDKIQETLVRGSWRFQRDLEFDGILADFGVLDSGGSCRVLIRISRALFYKDEAQIALGHLNLIERLQKHSRRPRFVLVVLGYVSPEVAEKLQSLVDDFIVYRADTFRANFGRALGNALPIADASNDSVVERQVLEKQLADVRVALEAMLKARHEESSTLEQRLALLLERQDTARDGGRVESARAAWADERRRIEERIQGTRRQRKLQAIQELERLRAKSEAGRKGQLILQASFAAVVAMICAFPSPSVFLRYRELYVPRTELLVGLVFAILAILRLLQAFNVFRLPSYLELSSSVGSVEELDRIAAAFLDSGGRLFSSSFLRPLRGVALFILDGSARYSLLKHANPQFRYAGAMAGPSRPPRTWELIDALLSERAAIVRRKIAKQLARAYRQSEIIYEKFPESLWSVAEAALLVEAFASKEKMVSAYWHELPEGLRTLAVLAGAAPPQAENAAMELGVALRGETSTQVASALAAAFRRGLDLDAISSLRALPERHLRHVLSELSPFDDGGLGTVDDLVLIDLIDQVYLFFQQLLYLRERTGALNRAEARV